MSMTDNADRSHKDMGDSELPENERTRSEAGADPLSDLIRLIQDEDPFKDMKPAQPKPAPKAEPPILADPAGDDDSRPLTLDEIDAAIANATGNEDGRDADAGQSEVLDTTVTEPSEPPKPRMPNADFVPPVLEVNPNVGARQPAANDPGTPKRGITEMDLQAALRDLQQAGAGLTDSGAQDAQPAGEEPAGIPAQPAPNFDVVGDPYTTVEPGSPYDDPAFHEQDRHDYNSGQAVHADGTHPVLQPQRRRGGVFAIGLFAGLLIIGASLFFAFNSSDGPGTGNVPFLRASDEPVKETPANPGGQQIANQDRLVFNGDNTTNADGERIVSRQEPVGQIPKTDPKDDSRPATAAGNQGLPQPVTPPGSANSSGVNTVPPPSDTAAPTPRRVRTVVVRPDGTVVATSPETQEPAPAPTTGTPTNIVPMPAPRPTNVASNTAAAPTQPATQPVRQAPAQSQAQPATTPVRITPSTNTAPATQPATVPAAPVAPVVPQTQTAVVGPATAPATAPAASAQTAAAGNTKYAVQIAARRSEEQARGAYDQVRSQYGSVVGRYQPLIQRADLGDRGVYYRLRLGPMNTQAEADAVCNNLKAAGMGDCLVRPL